MMGASYMNSLVTPSSSPPFARTERRNTHFDVDYRTIMKCHIPHPRLPWSKNRCHDLCEPMRDHGETIRV